MVKDIHHITIRDYSLFEKTGKAGTLATWPYKKEKLDSLLAEITRGLGSDQNQDQTLKKEHHRLTSIYRIQYLICLYEATYNLLVNKTQVDVWRAAIKRQKKGSDYTNLSEYVDKIRIETGIEIDPESWWESIIALKWEIDKWVDKYTEHFVSQTQSEGVTFMQIVLGVFSVLKFPINEEICLTDFFEMKRQAETIIRKMEAQANQLT